MKKNLLFPAILLISALGSSGCDPEEVCKAKYLADLALESFSSAFEYLDNGEEVYSISHTIINFIGDINGCESNAEAAAPNKFLQRITYSDNANFTNPVEVDMAQFSINELTPGAAGLVLDQVKFKQNGYYLFHSIADYTQLVAERNESNNEGTNPFERASTQDDPEMVIHVTKASNAPVFDKQGNRVFFQRLSTTISYE